MQSSTPTTRLGSVQHLCFGLLCFYLFLVFSRTPEYLAPYTGSPPLIFITGILALALGLLNGRFITRLKSTQAICLLTYTGWLLLSTMGSFWPGGSFQLLTQTWSKSLIGFFIVAATIWTIDQCKRAMFTIAVGLIGVEIAKVFLGAQIEGRLGLEGSGSLGNSNALAFHILVILPFALLMWMQGKRIGKITAIPVLAYGVVTVLQTGSRAGLVELAILMLVFFIRLSAPGKVAFMASFSIITVITVLMGLNGLVSDDAIERYKTLFSNEDKSEAFRSAEASQAIRTENFVQSVNTTFAHPLLGIGPGVFTPFMATEIQKDGRRSNWRNTHNAYTQISSESGLPAFFLYMTALAASLKAAFSIYRATRKRPEMKLVADMSFCLLSSLIVFSVNGVFDNNAYLFYFPLLAGLAVALNATVTDAALPLRVQPVSNRRTASVPAAGNVRGLPARPGVPVTIRALKRVQITDHR